MKGKCCPSLLVRNLGSLLMEAVNLEMYSRIEGRRSSFALEKPATKVRMSLPHLAVAGRK
jgi:hypothetical protein